MGKGKVALDTAGYHFDRGTIDTVVVIAPTGMHEVWPHECEAHLNVPFKAVTFRAGTKNADLGGMARCRTEGRLDVFCFNTEAVLFIESSIRAILKTRKVLLILDESQRIRTPGAKRTRTLWRLGELATMRRILTGTAVLRGLENLYAQYRFLHWQIIGCKTYTAFKSEYCIERGPYHEIVGYRNEAALRERIHKRTVYAFEKEMGLAEQVVSTRYVPLTEEQKRVYKSLKESFVAQVESGGIADAPLMITRLQKFSQIVSGHLRLDDASWERLPNHRLAEALDVVEMATSKIIVWGQWQPDIVLLGETLAKAGISYVTYYGGNTQKQNRDNLARFKGEPDVHAFLATQSSGGTGLTINEAKHTLNFSHTFDTERVWQSAKRNHRLGQDAVVHVTNLVSKGTVDVTMLKSQDRKAGYAAMFKDPKLLRACLDGEE